MNAALLQQKIYGAYAKAALRIGQTYTLYRPSGATDPIVPGNIVTTLPASFNAEDMAYRKPENYDKALWYCLVDGTQVQVGDYLVYQQNTYFIVAMQLTLPILAVQCNRRVRIGRMPVENGAGLAGYSGVVQSEEADVLGSSNAGQFVSGWPASILQGGSAGNDTTLPSGVKSSSAAILLPPSIPIAILESDVLQDDLGRNFAVYAAEQSSLGWRIQASEEHS